MEVFNKKLAWSCNQYCLKVSTNLFGNLIFWKQSDQTVTTHFRFFLYLLILFVKNGYSTVKLTVREAPTPAYGQLFANFCLICAKKQVFLVQKHYFKPFSVGQNCHICLQSGPRGLPPHIGPKSLILAPQDIPDISGYQLGFGCQCVKVYSNENPVTNQKIL